jgi:paraquat-inducible protein A
MIEVFMLAMLVAVVKLSSLARVVPGPAMWAFAALTVLFAVLASFDPRTLWNRLEAGAES